jgi:hypothetical protein
MVLYDMVLHSTMFVRYEHSMVRLPRVTFAAIWVLGGAWSPPGPRPRRQRRNGAGPPAVVSFTPAHAKADSSRFVFGPHIIFWLGNCLFLPDLSIALYRSREALQLLGAFASGFPDTLVPASQGSSLRILMPHPAVCSRLRNLFKVEYRIYSK